jgi:hypothetical protein
LSGLDPLAALAARLSAGEITEEQIQRAHQLGSPLAAQLLELAPAPDAELRASSSRDFYEAEPEEREEAAATFQARFAELAVQLQEVLGPPDLATGDLGGADPCVVTTFAEELYWRGIYALAAWVQPDGRYGYVALEQQDHELPISLLTGLATWAPD